MFITVLSVYQSSFTDINNVNVSIKYVMMWIMAGDIDGSIFNRY